MEYKLITREGCVHCDRLKRMMLFERFPHTEIRIGEDIDREQLLEWLNEAGVETRLLPYVVDPDKKILTGREFIDDVLYSKKRFEYPKNMVIYLTEPGKFRVTFTKKNGTDKTIMGSIKRGDADTALSPNNLISMYDDTGESWNSFRLDSVKEVKRIE